MANTYTKQTLIDGKRDTVIRMHIVGDGSGDTSSTNIFNAPDFNTSDAKIWKIQANLEGFSVNLFWEAIPNVDACTLSQGDSVWDFSEYGGLTNGNSGATGDVFMQTVGLGSGDEGTILLHMKKKNEV